MNLASIWKLPLLFVCENNNYAVNTPASYAIAIDELYKRAACYSMPGMPVDGNDVVAVREAAGEFIERARAGKGPAFLECRTFRWHGHFESKAPTDTRPKDEIEAWKKKDPIAAEERKLVSKGILTEAQLKEIDNQILAKIDEAVKFAEDSPYPAPEDALEDVYSK
jgi:acetoin:2,6-dichlorophenolindophenol oxidoreductase subunit alpha